MRYLVTGGAGFIGSHLACKLSNPINEIHIVDNLSNYYSPELKELRKNWVLSHVNTKFSNLDLSDYKATREFFNEFEFDAVFHLAGQPGVRMSRDASHMYTFSNLVAFESVLTNVIRKSIPNFLYASSSSVYGNLNKTLLSEDDMGISPISYYGATKLANEFAASALVRGTNTKARGMRFFTAYGPWGRPDMAYFRLINSALNTSPFELYGSGQALRDFTYVGDIVDSIEDLEVEMSQHSPGFSDVVNIGGGRPESMKSLIDKTELLTGQELQIIRKEQHHNDVARTMANTSKLMELTGKSPMVTIDEGLKETIRWAMRKDVIYNLQEWIDSVGEHV